MCVFLVVCDIYQRKLNEYTFKLKKLHIKLEEITKTLNLNMICTLDQKFRYMKLKSVRFSKIQTKKKTLTKESCINTAPSPFSLQQIVKDVQKKCRTMWSNIHGFRSILSS